MPSSPDRPEILAPAGTREAMQAAVHAGADAVYFGLQEFNARARAANFNQADLPEIMAVLHRSGVKGYVALNTLVFDSELPALMETLQACAEAGVDALIVQDLGVMRLAQRAFPELALHASTQMTCTDASSVEFARELGATRVVFARELSLEEIAEVQSATEVELEVFVHGALCVAYSGQCLTSEALGGRSANRGACAQACRLPYDFVVDGQLVPLGDKAFLLSPQDLDAANLVPELAKLGVRSLKLEGRLKGAEYVSSTTRLYRHAVDSLDGSATASPKTSHAEPKSKAFSSHLEKLRFLSHSSFSRGSGTGFLGGVNHQTFVDGETCDHRGLHLGHVLGRRQRGQHSEIEVALSAELHLGDGILVQGGKAGNGEVGGRIWALEMNGRAVEAAVPGERVWLHLGRERELHAATVGRRVFLTHSPRSERLLKEEERLKVREATVDFRLEGQVGARARLSATSELGGSVSVELPTPLEIAQKSPTSEAQLQEALSRLGATGYRLGTVTLAIPEGALVPLSHLNQARRNLIQSLSENAHRTPSQRPADYAQSFLASALNEPLTTTPLEPVPGGFFVTCRTLEQAEAALAAGAAGVYLDFLELKGCAAAVASLRSNGAAFVGVAPPRIRKPGEAKIDRYLRGLEPDAFLVRGLGTLYELRGLKKSPNGPLYIGDFSLNLCNRFSVAQALSAGLSAFTPSFDLNEQQLSTFLTELAPYAEMVLHQPMPLFHMEHCVYAALLSTGKDYKTCGRPCDTHKVKLRDRTGLEHPVEADVGCRNTVFHAQAQSAASLVPKLQSLGVRRFRVELVQETVEQTSQIVAAYRALLLGQTRPEELRRTLKAPLGYGVVSGSLRVIQGP